MMLGYGLVPALVALMLVGGVMWMVAGQRVALSGMFGALVAAGALQLGLWGMRLVLRGLPEMSLAGGLLVYSGQLLALLVLAMALRSAAWLDGNAFGLGLIIGVLVSQAGLVAGYVRSRKPALHVPTGQRDGH